MRWPPAGDRRRTERGVDVDEIRATTSRLCDLVPLLRAAVTQLAEAIEPLVRSAEEDDQ